MRYDLIIVGGGMVGAGFALALKPTGLRIAIVDARMPSNNDPRLFGLNVSSCQFLENLGLWPHLAPHSSPIHQVHVSNQGHFGAVRLHHEDANLPSLGYVVPARYVEEALNNALDELPNATFYRPARLIGLKQDNDGALLTLSTDDGDVHISSSIVIGADGTGSTVRELLDIGTETVDYQQSAIVTRVQLRRSHKQVAYERFNRHGAIAMLPLPENQCACIWSADTQEAERLMSLTDDEYLHALQNGFGSRLGRFVGLTKRHMFPLKMIRATHTFDRHVLLLGNSAHTLHPIAAQGFNLALYEVATLVEGIAEKINANKTLTTSDLNDMLAPTRKQQTVSVKVSHWLSQLFASNSLPKNVLFSLGMLGFDAVSPIKKKFISMMTGRSGRVPSLLMRTDCNEKHDAR